MAGWIKRVAEEEDEQQKEQARVIEIKPEAIRDAIKGDLEQIHASSKAMTDYIAEQKAERAAAQEAESARTRREAERVDDVDFLTNPEEAINKKLRPISESNAVMASMFVRREVLDNQEFYDDPEFKKRVDTMIDQQPLQARLDRSVIMNAYKVVRFDAMKEIEEGKIKSSLSGGGGNRGTRREDKDSDGGDIPMTPEEKSYARKLGVSEKDWISQKKEMEYV